MSYSYKARSLAKRVLEEYSEKRNTPITRSYLPRMDKLFEWGVIKAGDTAVIKNFNNSEAIVIDTRYVEFEEQKLTFNQLGEKVTGWSALNIYIWTIVKGSEKTLHEIRKEKLMSNENNIW